jgi:lipopolysaccharide/colanic/teichoic acid biosynthesis glycosyltransferase
MVKRLFDIVLSLSGLLLLSPLLLVIAAWVRLDSRGPIIFRQRRVGRAGATFEILKFRTMFQTSETDDSGIRITVAGDCRITGSGRHLRRYKLDELPQLMNVLRGDMSLVGPRPEVPEYVQHYPPETREEVLSVRPGITDLASLEFRHEERILAAAADPAQAYVDEILPAKLARCCDYVRQQSLWLDIVILWRTLLAVFR